MIVGRPSRVPRRVPGADGQPETAVRWIQLGRTRRAKSSTRLLGSATRRPACRPCGGAHDHRRRQLPTPARRARRRPRRRHRGGRRNRPHRLLGVRDHRRLEVPDGHAQERRVRRADAECRRPQDRRQAWDPARDEAAGEQCRAYGAANIMRCPTRLHITWQDDNTLRIETDAGTQTRLLHFGAAPPPGEPTWQGHSVAQWEVGGGGPGGARRAI